jgi:hypothetical protein
MSNVSNKIDASLPLPTAARCSSRKNSRIQFNRVRDKDVMRSLVRSPRDPKEGRGEKPGRIPEECLGWGSSSTDGSRTSWCLTRQTLNHHTCMIPSPALTTSLSVQKPSKNVLLRDKMPCTHSPGLKIGRQDSTMELEEGFVGQRGTKSALYRV